MIRTLPLVLLGALALPLPAQQPVDSREEAIITKRLQGLVPGRPQTCISQSHTRGSTHAGNVLLIENRSGVKYLSRFRNGCTVRSFETLINRSPVNQLCSGDIVEVADLQAGFTRGACNYGDFVPYRKPR